MNMWEVSDGGFSLAMALPWLILGESRDGCALHTDDTPRASLPPGLSAAVLGWAGVQRTGRMLSKQLV